MNLKKIILLLILINTMLLLCTQVSNADIKERLYPYSKDGVFCYLNLRGDVVREINPGYMVDDYIDSIAKGTIIANGKDYYTDKRGSQAENNNVWTKNPNLRINVRELKGDTVVDLTKKINSGKMSIKGKTVTYKEYDLSDGFTVKEYTNKSNIKQLYKKGKVFITNDKWLANKAVTTVVKYDNEKMIRLTYSENKKIKTLYVDYNGTAKFTKPAPTVKVTVDGKTLEFKNNPKIIDNIIEAPVEPLMKALGYSIQKGSRPFEFVAKKTLNKKEVKLDFASYENFILINGDKNKPLILNDILRVTNKETFMPIEAIAFISGYNYYWDSESLTFSLTKSKISTSTFSKYTEYAQHGGNLTTDYIEIGYNVDSNIDNNAETVLDILKNKIKKLSQNSYLIDQQHDEILGYLKNQTAIDVPTSICIYFSSFSDYQLDIEFTPKESNADAKYDVNIKIRWYKNIKD